MLFKHAHWLIRRTLGKNNVDWERWAIIFPSNHSIGDWGLKRVKFIIEKRV